MCLKESYNGYKSNKNNALRFFLIYIHLVGPNTRLYERDGGYVVLDISMKPRQGSQLLIQHGGGTELATLRGKSLITDDGEAIEGDALDDVTVIGVVTFTICDVRQDNTVV